MNLNAKNPKIKKKVSQPNSAKHKEFTMIKWNLYQGYVVSLTYKLNQCNIPYWQNKEQKPHDHLNRSRKGMWQHSTPFNNKKLLNKLKTEGNFLNLIKGNHEKPTASTHLMVKDRMLSPWDMEQDKDISCKEIKQQREIRGTHTGREEVNIIISTQNSKGITKTPKTNKTTKL